MKQYFKQLQDKKWLEEQYITNSRTYEDIGREIGCTKYGVYHAIKRLGIQSRKHSSKYPQLNDKEWLRKMYKEEGFSTKQIADLLGTTVGNVHSALTHSGISTRGYKEGLQTRFPDGRSGEKHPGWKGGLPKCDCGAELARRDAIRCIECERSSNRKGNNNVNWRGGITSENVSIRSSREMKLWRRSVFERDDYTCQQCGAKSGKGKKVILNADHIKPFSAYPELRLALDNGRTLCLDCHKGTDTYAGKMNRKS